MRSDDHWLPAPQRSTPARGTLVFIVRNIPESCVCLWDWDEHLAKWQIVKQLPGCPWHEGG